MSDAGLLAYTESAQKAAKRSSKRHDSKPVKSTYKHPAPVAPVKYNARRSKEAKLEFDDAKRSNYLTGFEKRKQQRRAKARRELEAQSKEALRAQRRQARELRRERARENIEAERLHFGDRYEGGLGDEETDEGQDDDEEDGEERARRIDPILQHFDTGDHLTTVAMVDDWDPATADDELIAAEHGSKAKPKAKSKSDPNAKSKPGVGHVSDLALRKKTKDGIVSRPGSQREPEPEEDLTPADEIAALVDPEAQASMMETDAVLVKHLKKVDSHAAQLAKNKADFHYESKAERQAQLEKIKEKRATQAAERKEEQIRRAKENPSLKPKKNKKRQIDTRLPEFVKRARAKKEAKKDTK